MVRLVGREGCALGIEGTALGLISCRCALADRGERRIEEGLGAVGVVDARLHDAVAVAIVGGSHEQPPTLADRFQAVFHAVEVFGGLFAFGCLRDEPAGGIVGVFAGAVARALGAYEAVVLVVGERDLA